MRLEVTCKEKTHLQWTEQHKVPVEGSSSQFRIEYTEHSASDRAVVFKQEVNLCSERLPPAIQNRNGTVQQYEFPFQVTLPWFVPATASFKEAEATSFWVSYEVRVMVLDLKGHSKRRVEAKRSFVVLPHPRPDMDKPYFIEPFHRNVNKCGCCNRGFMVMGAKCDSILIKPGGQFQCRIAFRNQSEAKIDSFDIEIIQERAVRAGSRVHNDRIVLGSIKKNGGALGETLAAHAAKLEKKHRRQSGEKMSHFLIRDLYDRLSEGLSPLYELKVATNPMETYSGALVKVEHYLLITLHTKTFVTNPSTTIPLFLSFEAEASNQSLSPPPPEKEDNTDPDTKYHPPEQLPINWAPSTQPVTIIVVDLGGAAPTQPAFPPSYEVGTPPQYDQGSPAKPPAY
uniref:Arrestin C-terminal-like domain-containing protein n=1 Tax=Chromera velia CCMP2878 TaxID=1169474 RepID=A0A0G4GNT4_9ALVE|eukprot:Cvel_22712.t1-p1 / transcript=Cvel_22712.t1 / gene=Cvel_22712 / organism=Chromera_velia_CCMP2878 / gene_product=hypothetical protein / transcript_product=hypothetical protein / location=Cvel_scaffold2262:28418-29608(+) / protein_length=397 / sequence_SO=supercontig / SO=protein_coding / is_pseudo=false